MRARRVRKLLAVTATLTLAVAGLGVGSAAATTAPTAAASRFRPAVTITPQVKPAHLVKGSSDAFDCEFTQPPTCYAPKAIRGAYGIDTLAKKGLLGQGRTIVIIDAFSSPTLASDLRKFDKLFKLPNPTLTQIAPDGLTPFDVNDGDQVGWAGEISLDVEWAHAIAPAARIVFVSAKSDSDEDILSALKYAVDHNLGDVISQSYYETETCQTPADGALEHQLFAKAAAKHITVLASSGDVGAGAYGCFDDSVTKGVAVPASDPLVTGVGGTSLIATKTGVYRGESGWSGSGGGVSTTFSKPAFQAGLPLKGRGVPDISLVADGYTGVLVVWSSNLFPEAPIFTYGGTSVGSPQWAGLVALVDQARHGRIGFMNPALYKLASKSSTYRAAYHDVTNGDNSLLDQYGNPYIQGYQAHPGYDLITGLGTPKADVLVPLLAASK